MIELTLDGTPVVAPFVNRPDAKGLLSLGAESCEIETDFGQRAKKENALGHVFVTRWSRQQDVPYWTVDVPKAGRYRVEVSYSKRGNQATPFEVEIGAAKLEGDDERNRRRLGIQVVPVGRYRLEARPDHCESQGESGRRRKCNELGEGGSSSYLKEVKAMRSGSAAACLTVLMAAGSGCSINVGDGPRGSVGDLKRETRSVARSVAAKAEQVAVSVHMGAGELSVEGGAKELLDAEFEYNVPGMEAGGAV